MDEDTIALQHLGQALVDWLEPYGVAAIARHNGEPAHVGVTLNGVTYKLEVSVAHALR